VLDKDARLKIAHDAPRLPWAAKRADRVAPAHQDLATRDVAGDPSGDLVDEIKRDPMIPSHGTTFGAFGIGDDAIAPSEATGP